MIAETIKKKIGDYTSNTYYITNICATILNK